MNLYSSRMIIKFNLFEIVEKSGTSQKTGKPYKMLLFSGMEDIELHQKDACFQTFELSFSGVGEEIIRVHKAKCEEDQVPCIFYVCIGKITGVYRDAVSASATLYGYAQASRLATSPILDLGPYLV